MKLHDTIERIEHKYVQDMRIVKSYLKNNKRRSNGAFFADAYHFEPRCQSMKILYVDSLIDMDNKALKELSHLWTEMKEVTVGNSKDFATVVGLV